ncbi:alpha/beta hydrolase [Paraburkholderia caballeronis]|uniref:Acetyl esterase n=1 Tax=Paraburkholderia caballeronis TaxID=416943 RepID=A0A1H7JF47_9BURK|nr:alpha/beta hydrolase [Paraburkholderia caballeronis]PXW27448.1 acetyl esterase [Paraburkholderia caballeronis]PXX02922.1 acetyl esterase [Paraburkholderia caballeronis]RAK03647.1 acetyl esterase [Paraburkholderia caballeronis]SEC28160.1 acetyl esterase [Paraburkholderia caballeronis]SEK73271.1 acetyl esterase [Paraburkholderia caballeronis]
MPLNPNVELVLAMIARAGRPPYHTLTPDEARAAYDASASVLEIPAAPMHAVEDLDVPTRDGASIRARLYLPVEPHWADPLPALVYFHGGGFTVGSVETHDALCRMYARDAHCAVLSVDYRLAPAHRFPTAVEDAFDAWRWLHDHAAEHAIDAARIAVGGDSAGGTLATVCAVLARDAGIAPVLQLLIYPGAGGHQQTASHRRLAEGYLLSAKTIQWFFSQYLRTDADRDDWRFAPLDGTRGAPDFAGVAPAWIAVAEYDPLVDEGIAYADKLRAAGNRVTLVEYPGMVHEFFKLGAFVREAVAAHADAAAALREAFGTG